MSFGNGARGGKGWAAFDREQRRKRQGLPQDDDVVEDPFPALPSKHKGGTRITSNSSTRRSSNLSSLDSRSWAHQWESQCEFQSHGLMMIEDQDDIDASPSLHQSLRFDHTANDPSSYSNDDAMNNIIHQNTQHHDHDHDHNHNHNHNHDVTATNLHCDSCATVKTVSDDNDMERLSGIPIEPEWEDEYHDDVYLRHRKHALRTMRSASQHSKAATNAFLRGDHVSAHQHSLKAHHQWLAAQTLNSKAANDILAISNSQNDVWKLDLHGLHASEAIHVLQHHLQTIETKLLWNRSVSPNSLQAETTRIVRSHSFESLGCVEDKQQPQQQQQRHQASLKQKPTSLQVITGVGNHSRGQASLPAAVRGFLVDNGYRFEELKPGVITVRPKFRLLN